MSDDKPIGGRRPGADGADLIRTERVRQVFEEGWTADHDLEHDACELVMAAAAYAHHAVGQLNGSCYDDGPKDWPWETEWWKPSEDPVRNLVKAGALLAAEIDRIRRTSPVEKVRWVRVRCVNASHGLCDREIRVTPRSHVSMVAIDDEWFENWRQRFSQDRDSDIQDYVRAIKRLDLKTELGVDGSSYFTLESPEALKSLFGESP